MQRVNDDAAKKRYIERFNLQTVLSAEMIDALELQTFEMGEFIFHQNSVADTFYILVEGKLQVDFLHSNGRQSILSITEPLHLMGDIELFDSFPSVKNVLVLNQSFLLACPAMTIRELGKDDPNFLRFIIHHIVKKIDATSDQLTQFAMPLKSRLAHYLLSRAQIDGETMILESRPLLAGRLGTSVRHLNRVLKQFHQAQIISLQNKTLQLIDSTALLSEIRQS